ncbi:MAG: hypothetical protein V4690_01120 [Patescibacteria group bacterium]
MTEQVVLFVGEEQVTAGKANKWLEANVGVHITSRQISTCHNGHYTIVTIAIFYRG